MTTNLLDAICHIVESDIHEVAGGAHSQNKMNRQGEPLEMFVKDAFAGVLGTTDELMRERAYQREFSYAGNQNNPPDFMVSGGDAVEVKKLNALTSQLQLNSSYPKIQLRADSPMISATCRNAERWVFKDLLYVVGNTVAGSGALQRLWLVYGDCYAAQSETYEGSRQFIREALAGTGLDFSPTNELGRLNKIDPLGITDLRVRGMYLIASPEQVFSKYLPMQVSHNGRLTAVVSLKKFESFPSVSVERLTLLHARGLRVFDIEIANPNNPAVAMPVKMIDWIKW